jgi:cytoplasmic iron level regulating protein YaaA (DUF328/UPF0246 family)
LENRKNLYEFWKATITKTLNKELENDEGLFVNLASNRYFSAVQKLKSSCYILADFKDYKDGKLKLLVFLLKKRDMMVRYIIWIQMQRR